jgi:pimeloyl-ACP methyl ester carboxylesterase
MNEVLASLLAHPRLAAARHQAAWLDAAAEQLVTEDETCRIVWRRWGQGPHLILLHGAYGSWLHWVRNIASLSADHTVWVPDIPGFGESSLRDPENVMFDGVGRSMAHAFASFGQAAPAGVVAFSFGTRIAAEMLRADPQSYSGVVLAGPMGFAERVPLRIEPRRWRDAADIETMMDIQRHNLLAIMLHEAASADDLAVYVQMRNTFASRVTPKAPRDASVWSAFKAAGRPLHAVWGQYDAYHWSLLAQRYEIVRQWLPEARVDTIADAGHWLMYERPTEFEAFVRMALVAEGLQG